MKKIFKLCFLALSLVIAASCDSGFDTLNVSKTGATSVDPAFTLNSAIINSSPTGSLIYEIAIVQQWFSSNTGVLEGGNFNKVVVNNTPANWTNYYQNVIKYTNDVIVRITNDQKLPPASQTFGLRTNLLNMARIVQANAFMILTDTYGDIPYGEAGGGYTAQIFFPKYETQQAIYPKIIDELTAAVAALDPAGKIETADVLYSGNIAQWKKFGNSILLRAGMRLIKQDLPKATSAINAAVTLNGGVIVTNADNAVIRHDANFVNGIGNTVNGGEAANFYMSDVFVKSLQGTSTLSGANGGPTILDPRLKAIAVRFVGATSGATQTSGVATTVPANQYGMPIGSTDGAADVAAGALPLPGGGTRFAFSQVDRTRLVKRTSPMFLVAAGQNNLLLAEVALRSLGGLAPAGANALFRAGIIAHLDQMASYDAASAIPVGDADRIAYLADPGTSLAGVLATDLPKIGYQYWLASFLHGPEAWANFRRIGQPALTPNPFSGSAVPGSFIQRLTYPPSETLVNTKNVTDAITAMGADALSTKVYWAK
ncbi:MAG TPA: SusD/RagB family nutrient-binding outer membrane lipoprotein [Cyclobacteriaceae bacterium]|nr:SusD/RagB family nutrient-binding outer membrane lipoprotein [Cyclobacteriaceae bacterium]